MLTVYKIPGRVLVFRDGLLKNVKLNIIYSTFLCSCQFECPDKCRLCQISNEGQKFVSHFTNKEDQEQKEKFTNKLSRHAEGNKVHTKDAFFMSEPLRQSKLRKMLFSGNKRQSDVETTHEWDKLTIFH